MDVDGISIMKGTHRIVDSLLGLVRNTSRFLDILILFSFNMRALVKQVFAFLTFKYFFLHF